MGRWLKVGMAIFAAGALLEFLLLVVALTGIESPTSWTWATLNIVAMLLLIAGLLTTYISRRRS